MIFVNQDAGRPAGITNAIGVQVSSMLPVRKEEAMGSWMIAASPSIGMPAAPTGNPAIQYLTMPERRRNVAQVRRLVPKNRDFFAVRDSAARCDDLLTSTVDNSDRAGL
jgi:hypothetical protein